MTPLDDDDLRAMLEARAGRASIDPVAIVTEGRRRALEPPLASPRGPVFGRVAAALGGLAVFAAVIALVAVPLAFRPAASPIASSSGPARTPPPMQGAVTVSQLESALGHPGTAVGITVALQGELIPDPVSCATTATCRVQVDGVASPHVVVGVDGQDLILPFSGRLSGVFALRITDRSIEGRVVLEELGQIAPAGDSLTWPVSGVAAAGRVLADLLATTGWIVRTPLHPCPSTEGQNCGTEDYLTEEAFQPARIDGSVVGPPTDTSINLPMGSYDAWAPAPNVLPDGVEPRPVTLLLRLIKGVTCPTPKDANTSIDCYGLPYDTWQIAGRLDPLPEAPTASPDPATTPAPERTDGPSPAVSSDRYPGGIPTAINGEPVLIGLDAQARWREATDDGSFLVGGWFDSNNLNICSGGIGPQDPNPLAARGCPRYTVDGVPGRPIYGVDLPDGDGPIVLRVHTRDPGAATCFPEYQATCRERTVVDAVAWFGDPTTAAAPIGPAEARRIATTVFVMEWRVQPDGSQAGVDEDVFTVPIACPAPWPSLLFSVHGDPRYGLIAVFPDTDARKRFEAETDPLVGPKCLDAATERPAAPRWVGQDNMLALVFADDAFATRLAHVLADPQVKQKALAMTEPGFDRTLGTVTDYLVARAAGEVDHALGERLVFPFQEAEATAASRFGWAADATRRAGANALDGRLETIDEQPTKARVGPSAWRAINDAGVTGARIVRVVYDGATDPALATEEYVVIHMPESEFRDWQLIRIASEPYPVATAPTIH